MKAKILTKGQSNYFLIPNEAEGFSKTFILLSFVCKMSVAFAKSTFVRLLAYPPTEILDLFQPYYIGHLAKERKKLESLH